MTFKVLECTLWGLKASSVHWGLQAHGNRLLSRKPNTIHVLRHSSNRSNGHSQGSQLDTKENREEWQNQVLTSWEVHRKRQPSRGYQKKATVLSGGFRLQRAIHTHRGRRPYNPMYGTALVTTAACPTHNCTRTISSGSSPVTRRDETINKLTAMI